MLVNSLQEQGVKIKYLEKKKKEDEIKYLPININGEFGNDFIEDYKIIKEKASQRRNEHQVQLEINMERLGSKMIEMHKVQKSFGEKIILNHFNYSFQRNERIGIIGKNGTGKSTFLNLLTSKEKVDSGKIIWGETLKFGKQN